MSGITINEAVKELGVTKQCIHSWLKRLDLQPARVNIPGGFYYTLSLQQFNAIRDRLRKNRKAYPIQGIDGGKDL